MQRLLEQYGGHTHAAGLTLKLENVDAFSRRFEEVVSHNIKERSLNSRDRIRCGDPAENYFS